jgi:hypothetical protein
MGSRTSGQSRELFFDKRIAGPQPRAQTVEFYGVCALSSKCVGLLGLFVPAVVASIFGSSRLSIMTLIVCCIVGGLILSRVPEEKGVARRGMPTPKPASCQRHSLKGTEHV